MVAALLIGTALALMALALLALAQSRRAEQMARVHRRLSDIAMVPAEASTGMPVEGGPWFLGQMAKWLGCVGITLEPKAVLGLLLALLGVSALIATQWGLLAALIFGGVAGLAAIVIPQVRYRQRVEKLIGQIPLFIDQVVRSLVTGRNLEGAMKLATEDLKAPLRDVLDRAQRSVDLGADMGDALRDAAEFHDIKELHLLAMTIQSSRLYGGSPREMLESIVVLIRQREQMQRELRAMTGETRMSAWVLGFLPTGVAGYMVWMNPGYLSSMWEDPSGQRMLMIALGMQVVGGLVLWRMVKSV